MCKLTLRNIGAIRQVVLELNKITVLLGPQSSGKSTISKILCHCQWIEKRCYINFEEESKRFMADGNFIEGIEEYHRMEGYFRDDSYVLYEGNFVVLEYKDRKLHIKNNGQECGYDFPKLCYIPAERNLVTAIPNLKKYNETNDLILYFMYDWFTAREYLKNLDLSDMIERSIRYEYSKSNDTDHIYDGDNRLKLVNASSGVQSVLPLYAVAKYVLDSIYKRVKPLSSEEKMQVEESFTQLQNLNRRLEEIEKEIEKEANGKKIDIKTLKEELDVLQNKNKSLNDRFFDSDFSTLLLSFQRDFFYQRSDVYVEEPEQNLFPEAQAKIVYWLFSVLINDEREHSLFLTTHSPYILFAINNCMMGGVVGDKLSEKEKLGVWSHKAWIDPKLVTIYEIHDGMIRSVQDEEGLLVNNYLNRAYRQVNSEYLTMLDYYED